MANQHPQYPRPGPSTYYSHSPPHPFGYGHNPGPVPYYQYPMPPMNGIPSMPPTSPRLGGAGRGGYHPHRPGGPNYQHFQHVPPPPQHYMPPHPMTPTAISPASPYAHPQKYPHSHQVPYSPSYPPQPNGPYPSAWPAQPLSPLPKQLSMLPPPQPQYHDPQPAHTSQLLSSPIANDIVSSVPISVPPPALNSSAVSSTPHVSSSHGQLSQQLISSPQAPSSPQPPSSPQASSTFQVPSSPQIPTSPHVPSSPQVQSTHTLEEPSASDAPTSPSSQSSFIGLLPTFVIWSRKGRPSDAPGIIISPRANPPPHIVENASQLPSPPPSPKPRRKVVVEKPSLPPAEHVEVHFEEKESSPEAAEVISSSASETTPTCSTAPDTPMPGSPVSTNTSISLAAASPALGKQPQPLTSPSKVEKSVVEVPSSETVVPVVEEQQPAAEMAPSQAPAPVASAPSATVPPDASTAKTTPPKKSWASLLQPTDATASSSKSRLPVSSVVGYSIPAGAMTGSSSQSSNSTSLNTSARPELLNLLSIGPTGPAPPPKIRPRGLINTGNMCFANAVLQVLVYCPPFHRLFSELGKYITGPVVGSQKEGSKATPLVDATIKFLREFTSKPSVYETNSKAKGKEREEDGFDELDSFIPTYVYDVMKEKKRFANMVGGHQEDAEEFLGFFLDTLEEELLSITNSLFPSKPSSKSAPVEDHNEDEPQDNGWLEVVGKRNRAAVTRTTKIADSPITRIFGGKFRSTLRAPHQRDSVTVEDWRSLRLDIQPEQVTTVKDALQQISHPHAVQISLPTRPGQIIEATQQALIESLPPILILHMKRFHYDTKVHDVVKIGKHVKFGPELEIGSDIIAPARRAAQPVKYQLFAVLYHHGQSASGGHYTLDVLHPNRDMNDRPRPAWIRIDDELVSDVRAEDVFNGQDRDDRCAYLLFYRRIGGGIPTRT